MSENVKSLFGGPIGVFEVNEMAIRVLTEALEKAKSGEIVGVSMAMLHHDGRSSWQSGGLIGCHSVLGALEMAKADIIGLLQE